MDAYVPQRQGVVRLSLAALRHRWPGWVLAVVWMVLLASLPWWIGIPLLLALTIVQLAQVPRLHRYRNVFRRALWWGLIGVLVASYRAFGGRALGLTYTMLAALVGFSLLILLESWQTRKPLRHDTLAAASPEWRDMAMASAGPTAVIIEIDPPVWLSPEDASFSDGDHAEHGATNDDRIGRNAKIRNVHARLSLSTGKGWIARPMTGERGVVLYDRDRDKIFRLRGWRLFGWHGDEAWLTRGDDQAPLALSHVLGQDYIEH